MYSYLSVLSPLSLSLTLVLSLSLSRSLTSSKALTNENDQDGKVIKSYFIVFFGAMFTQQEIISPHLFTVDDLFSELQPLVYQGQTLDMDMQERMGH